MKMEDSFISGSFDWTFAKDILLNVKTCVKIRKSVALSYMM